MSRALSLFPPAPFLPPCSLSLSPPLVVVPLPFSRPRSSPENLTFKLITQLLPLAARRATLGRPFYLFSFSSFPDPPSCLRFPLPLPPSHLAYYTSTLIQAPALLALITARNNVIVALVVARRGAPISPSFSCFVTPAHPPRCIMVVDPTSRDIGGYGPLPLIS